MKRIEVGITHEVIIKGDKSWIRLAISDDYEGDIDTDEAIDALAKKVNQKLLDVIEETVATVTNYNN